MLLFLVGGRTMCAATRAKSEGHSYVDWSLKLEGLGFRMSGVGEVVAHGTKVLKIVMLVYRSTRYILVLF